MYKDGDGYKHFVVEEQFNGTVYNLIEEIVKDFVNEGIVKSELGDFYNIAGIVKTEKYGDLIFNIGIHTGIDGELDIDGVLKEEVIKEKVIMELFHKIGLRSRELYIDGYIKERDVIMKDSNIKATYTLAYS